MFYTATVMIYTTIYTAWKIPNIPVDSIASETYIKQKYNTLIHCGPYHISGNTKHTEYQTVTTKAAVSHFWIHMY